MSGNYKVRHLSNTTDLLFIFRLATCIDPTGLSSGPHSNQFMFRKLRTFLGSQIMFTIGKCERFMSNSYNW